jgi:hypothetical protein
MGAISVLRYGYIRGVPDDVVHMVWDRISAVGSEASRLIAYLHDLPLRGDWQDRAMELLRAGVMDPRVDEEFVLYADQAVVIRGNTQASAGYLYICAYFRPAS